MSIAAAGHADPAPRDDLDLDAYFERVGYDGPREPTLAVLQELHALQPRAIPFENLDLLLGYIPKLDIGSLQAKLVTGRRGGYCFEQNSLFAAVLRALGFSVAPLMARVEWLGLSDGLSPRTHMLLRVDLPDGRYVADVGFGGLTLTAPLRLEPHLEQVAGPVPFRLVPRAGGEFQLQARLAEGWTPVYRFGFIPERSPDIEVVNWFVSTHPSSRFRHELMAALVCADRRYGLHDNTLTIRTSSSVERRVLGKTELAEALESIFAIPCPEALDPIFEEICAPEAEQAR